jgi:hypothetical protein
MPSREETDAILKQIENLKDTGSRLLSSLPKDNDVIVGRQSPQFKRWIRWLNEALELVQAITPEGSYVYKEAADLRARGDFDPRESPVLTEQVDDLLDAAGRATRLKTQDAVGDDFRRAVEIAVKDAYFSSWPFMSLRARLVLL